MSDANVMSAASCASTSPMVLELTTPSVMLTTGYAKSPMPFFIVARSAAGRSAAARHASYRTDAATVHARRLDAREAGAIETRVLPPSLLWEPLVSSATGSSRMIPGMRPSTNAR